MKLLVILFLLKFICDLFMFLPKNGIANYADDNTPYSTGTGIHNIISDLEQVSDILSNKSLTTVFSNSVIIMVAKTGTKGVCMDTLSVYL